MVQPPRGIHIFVIFTVVAWDYILKRNGFPGADLAFRRFEDEKKTI
jgi:hypothetical protein